MAIRKGLRGVVWLWCRWGEDLWWCVGGEWLGGGCRGVRGGCGADGERYGVHGCGWDVDG